MLKTYQRAENNRKNKKLKYYVRQKRLNDFKRNKSHCEDLL